MRRGSTAASADTFSNPPATAASDRITREGTRHAVTATAAFAELETGDRDDLDPGVAHPADRVRVALVRDHEARLDRDRVVGVVPLLTLGLVLVAAGLDDVEVR